MSAPQKPRRRKLYISLAVTAVVLPILSGVWCWRCCVVRQKNNEQLMAAMEEVSNDNPNAREFLKKNKAILNTGGSEWVRANRGFVEQLTVEQQKAFKVKKDEIFASQCCCAC